MKRTFNLIVILSLFAQFCHAQTIKTEEEYKVFYDSIVTRLQSVEKDTGCYIGKPFSEFVKQLDKYGLKIIRVRLSDSDNHLYKQHLYSIFITFTSEELEYFADDHKWEQPIVFVHFKEILPYQKALSLRREYNSSFGKEVEKFYSDAIIESVRFAFMKGYL